MLRNLLIGAIFLYWLMGFVSMAASLSDAATKTLWGATSVAVLGVYYVAPLSSVAKVIAERDSSSLHWPLCTMNIINGMLWFAYGLALKDWFVCLPVRGVCGAVRQAGVDRRAQGAWRLRGLSSVKRRWLLCFGCCRSAGLCHVVVSHACPACLSACLSSSAVPAAVSCPCVLQNGIGAGFNVVCLVMCFVFPARRKQQLQQPGQLLDELNPGANWGALRLQSIARPPAGSPAAVAAAAAGGSGGGGGFFDLTQLRWRTSQAVGSFRGGSFLRMLSGSQRSSTADGLAGPAAGGAAAGAGAAGAVGRFDAAVGSSAGVARGLDQEAESDMTGVKKAGVGDVEQAHVVADSTRNGLGDQQQQQQPGAPGAAQRRL